MCINKTANVWKKDKILLAFFSLYRMGNYFSKQSSILLDTCVTKEANKNTIAIARKVWSTIWKCLDVENNETGGNPMNVVSRKRKVDRHARTYVRTYLPSHFVLVNSRVNKTRGSRAGHGTNSGTYSAAIGTWIFRQWPGTPSPSNGLFITLLATNGPPFLDAYKHEERCSGRA